MRLEACGVCHTDMYTASGADPSGYAPCVLGHEGAGVVEAIGEGVTSVAVGDHVVTLFSPQCGECVHCVDDRTNLCMAIRAEQNQGYLPDHTTRLSRDGEPIRHFMGTSTFAEATVMPEIALAKVNPDMPMDARGAVRVRALDRAGRGDEHREGHRPGSTCVVFGAGLVGLGAVAGARLCGAERIICVDLSEDRLELATRPGRDGHLGRRREHRRARSSRRRAASAPTTRSRRPASSSVMAQAVEAARMGWGLCTVAGVAGKGETLDVIPRWLIQGRRIAGSSFGGVKGRDQVPQLVAARAGRRHRRRAADLPRAHARRGQPRLRADARPGRHPLRDHLLRSVQPEIDIFGLSIKTFGLAFGICVPAVRAAARAAPARARQAGRLGLRDHLRRRSSAGSSARGSGTSPTTRTTCPTTSSGRCSAARG